MRAGSCVIVRPWDVGVGEQRDCGRVEVRGARKPFLVDERSSAMVLYIHDHGCTRSLYILLLLLLLAEAARYGARGAANVYDVGAAAGCPSRCRGVCVVYGTLSASSTGVVCVCVCCASSIRNIRSLSVITFSE